MAAPKKPKSAGVQKGRATAVKSLPATATAIETKAATESPVETESLAANGAGNGEPTAEMIRLRAYEIFMARDGSSGDELSDWLTAEREIMKRASSTS